MPLISRHCSIGGASCDGIGQTPHEKAMCPSQKKHGLIWSDRSLAELVGLEWFRMV
jgi:hypothetical protein